MLARSLADPGVLPLRWQFNRHAHSQWSHFRGQGPIQVTSMHLREQKWGQSCQQMGSNSGFPLKGRILVHGQRARGGQRYLDLRNIGFVAHSQQQIG
jgi:hypothetical protein